MASVLRQFSRPNVPLLRLAPLPRPGRPRKLQRVCECSTSTNVVPETSSSSDGGGIVKISKAMHAYQERAKAHDKFMVEQMAEYEIGRRHLANMMGEDPETFTQEDIDAAIQYLLPSGLFEPRARPSMKHPTEVFAKRKAAEFDISGRPFHTLFYTGLPSYYQALHDLSKLAMSLDKISDRMAHYKVDQQSNQSFKTGGTEWVSKEELEGIFLEKLFDKHYNFFIRSITRLVEHPYSSRAQDFIMKFRKPLVSTQAEEIPKLLYTPAGVPYMSGEGHRKSTQASVTVYGLGSGKFDINGKDIRFFDLIQDREQVVFPLQFTGLLGKVDLVATCNGVSQTGIAGAIRLAISKALQSFVDEDMREKMRIAGLLTWDPRRKERKKPGQKGARAKYTWKKR